MLVSNFPKIKGADNNRVANPSRRFKGKQLNEPALRSVGTPVKVLGQRHVPLIACFRS